MTDSTHSTNQPARAPGIDRRAILATLAASAAALGVGTAALAQEGHEHHMSHDMGGHADAPAHQAVIDAALDCVKRGEICLSHCITLLGQGDTSLKDCIRTVTTMLPTCAALARLAALDAKRLGEFAKVCADICSDCQAECKKHQDHHAACKACAEACGTCVEECKKLV